MIWAHACRLALCCTLNQSWTSFLLFYNISRIKNHNLFVNVLYCNWATVVFLFNVHRPLKCQWTYREIRFLIHFIFKMDQTFDSEFTFVLWNIVWDYCTKTPNCFLHTPMCACCVLPASVITSSQWQTLYISLRNVNYLASPSFMRKTPYLQMGTDNWLQ